jgi:carbonic anhydrase/acetyltransferase-like protein (isoleucine patch superfamily)
MDPKNRTLAWDWYNGTIPRNVEIDETAYVETSYSFLDYRSEQSPGVKLGRGASAYKSTMFDVGANGRVMLGEYTLVHGARIICDSEITVGDFSFISWNVVLMDSYRLPLTPSERRRALELIPLQKYRIAAAEVPSLPIHIQRNVWIGFDTCVLPGITIGEGAIVGARSVVTEDVEPYTIVGGNPATLIRRIAANAI